MSAEIENRVVQLTFDNEQFEKAVSVSQNTLDNLNKSIDQAVQQSNKSMEAFKDALANGGVGNGIDKVSQGFSAMGVVGATVLAKLTSGAYDLVQNGIGKITSGLTKAFQLADEGGKRRASNIQQAKFQLEGLGIAWSTVSDDINYAVEDTAYGLDEAAKACSQLSASGVQAGEDMKAALRGISGVAAMTNTTYDNISPIFTTIAGQGKVTAMQLNQLANRGINAAATLADYLGTTEANVRAMVSKGKIDFQTFADAMDDAFGEHAKDANKTFTGAMSNIKAALSQIGEKFWTPIIGNVQDLETGLSAEGFYTAVNVLNALRIGLKNLKTALDPVVNAWTDMITQPLFLDAVHIIEGVFGTMVEETDEATGAIKKVYKATEWMESLLTGIGYVLEWVSWQIRQAIGWVWAGEDELDALGGAIDFINFALSHAANTLRRMMTYISQYDFLSNIISAVLFGFTGLKTVLSSVSEVIQDVVAETGIFKFLDNLTESLRNTMIGFQTAMYDGWFDYDGVYGLATILMNLIKIIGQFSKAFFGGFVRAFQWWQNKGAIDSFITSLAKATNSLVLTEDQLDKLMTVFQGLFSILDIILIPIRFLVQLLGVLSGKAIEGVGTAFDGALDVMARVANVLIDIDIWLDIFATRAVDKVAKILKTLKRDLGPYIDILHKKLKTLFEYVKPKLADTLKRVKEVVSNFKLANTSSQELSNKFKTGVENMKDAWTRFCDYISNSSLKDVFQGIKDAFETIGDFFKRLFEPAETSADDASESIDEVTDSVEKLGNNRKFSLIKSTSEALSDALDELNEIFKKVGKGIHGFLEEIDSDRLFAVMMVFSGIAGILGTNSLVKNMTKFVDAVANMNPAKSLFDGFADLGSGAKKIGEAVKNLTVFIGFALIAKGIKDFVDSMMELSTLPADKLKSVTGSMVMIAGALAATIYAVAYGINNFAVAKASVILAEALGMSYLLNTIAKVFKKMESVNPEKALSAGLAISWICRSLRKVSIKDMPAKSAFVQLIGIAIVINQISKALSNLASIPSDQLTKGAANMVIVFYAVSKLSKHIGKVMRDPLKKASAKTARQELWDIAAIFGVVAIVVGEIAYLSKLIDSQGGSKNLWIALSITTILLGEMAGMVLLMNKFPPLGTDVSKNILATAGLLATIGLVIGGLSILIKKIGGGAVWNSVGVISVVMLEIAGLMVIMNKFPTKIQGGITKAFEAVATTVAILGAVIGVLAIIVNKYGANSIWNATGVVSIMVLEMAGLTYLLGKFPPDSSKLSETMKAMQMLALAIAGVGAVIAVLSWIINLCGAGAVWQSVGIVSIIVIELGALTYALSEFAKNPANLMASVKTMQTLAIAIAAIGAVISVIALIINGAGAGAVWQSVGIVAIIALALVGVIAALTQITKTANPAGLAAINTTMIIFSVALLAVAAVLAIIEQIAKDKDCGKSLLILAAIAAGIVAVMWLLGKIGATAMPGLAAISATIIAFAVAAFIFAKAVDAFAKAMENIVKGVKALATLDAKTIVKAGLALIGVALAIAVASPFLVLAAGGLVSVAEALFKFGDSLLSFATKVGEALILFGLFGSQIHQICENIKVYLPEAISAIAEAIKNSVGPITDIIKTVIDAISLAIIENTPTVLFTIKSVVGNILITLADIFLGPEAQYLLTSIALFVVDIIDTVVDTLGVFFPGLKETVGGKIDDVRGVLTEKQEGLKEQSKTATEGVVQGLKDGLAVEEGSENDPASVTGGFLDNIKNALTNANGDLNFAGMDAGENVVAGLSSGITNGDWAGIDSTLSTNLGTGGGGLLGKMLNVLGIASPSKETIKMGKYLVAGLKNGLENNKGGLLSKGASVAGALINKLSNALSNKATSSLGKQVSNGLASGIEFTKNLADAAANVAKKLLEKIKKVLGVASPSKEAIKISEWTVVGLANGLTDNTSIIEDAAKTTGNSMLDSLREAVANASDMITDEELQPVIKPSIDLREIQAGLEEIDTTTDKVMKVATRFTNQNQESNPENTVSGQDQVVNNYYFNQNNTSPEALSAIDIYRNTKSLFAIQKGVTR